MKRLNRGLLIILLIVLTNCGQKPDKLSIVDYDYYIEAGKLWLFVLEGEVDGVYSEALQQTLKPGRFLTVYQGAVSDNPIIDLEAQDIRPQLTRLSQNNLAAVKPWLITVGKMDDEEGIDVFVGAFYKTRYYPAETRPYFFKYDNRLIRKWTGSYLDAEAFAEAEFVDRDKDGYDELRVYEKVRGSETERQVSYYVLKGFSPYKIE